MSDFPTNNPVTLEQLRKMGVHTMAEYVAKRDEIRSHLNLIMLLGTDYESKTEGNNIYTEE